MRAHHGVAAALALVAACFNPTYDNPTCGAGGACPAGLTCDVTTNTCQAGGNVADAPDGDAPAIDAPDGDAAPDIDAPFMPPAGFLVPLSAQGPDALYAAVAGPDGTFYAAGISAGTPTGPRYVVVVHLSPSGLVTSFGTGGVANTGVALHGGAGEVAIAVQSTGKIIVAATTVSERNPNDRDVAVIRLNSTGSADGTFGFPGTSGIVMIDLSQAYDPGTGSLVGFDAARAIAIGASDEIFVHGQSRATGNAAGGGPRTDTDFTILRVEADGTFSVPFGGGDGKFTLDLQESNASPRGMTILADGTLIAGGYANTPAVGSAQPVLYKVTANGGLVSTFANSGVFHDVVLAAQTELHGVAVVGGDVVTQGYGRNSGTTNDWVSLRFNAITGARDLTWGGAPGGAVLIDPTGAMDSDNGRSIVALPNNKAVLVGSAGASSSVAQDAAYAMLTASGTLDTAYGDGVQTLAFGSNGFDQLWGGAVSGTNLLLVGWKGAPTPQTVTANDDAYAVVIPLL